MRAYIHISSPSHTNTHTYIGQALLISFFGDHLIGG